MAAATLDGIVEEFKVSYNVLYRVFPWLHAINLKANFPFRRPRGYTQLDPPHRFEAKVIENGKVTGYIGRLKRDDEMYTKALYNSTSKADSWLTWTHDSGVDIRSQWVQNPALEAKINETDKLAYTRLTVSTLSRKGKEPVTRAQVKKHFMESALGAVAKLFPPVLLWDYYKHRKREAAKPEGVQREPYKFWNWGTKRNIEGIGRPGHLFSDQNVVYQVLTAWLGKRYTIHDDNGGLVAEYERDPLIKLLSFGLKNVYRARIYDKNPAINSALVDAMIADIDEVQHERTFRLYMPKDPENLAVDNKLLQGLRA